MSLTYDELFHGALVALGPPKPVTVGGVTGRPDLFEHVAEYNAFLKANKVLSRPEVSYAAWSYWFNNDRKLDWEKFSWS